MIPDWNEVRRSIPAAWQLFFGRRAAMVDLDQSTDGFWRSFALIIYMAPFYLIVAEAFRRTPTPDSADAAAEVSVGAYFTVVLVRAVIDWFFVFPVFVAVLARVYKFSDRYVPLVVARNWSALVAIQFYAVPAILFLAGILPQSVFALSGPIALLLALWYQYNVVRTAGDLPISLCVGIVVIDVILNIFIVLVFERLTGY